MEPALAEIVIVALALAGASGYLAIRLWRKAASRSCNSGSCACNGKPLHPGRTSR